MLFIVFVTIILGVSSMEFLSNSNDDLINFIDLLNNRDDELIEKSKYPQTDTDAELKRSNENDKYKMMRLLQKNYDATQDRANDGETLHFIRNPELIDNYRAQMRKRSRELLYDEADEYSLKKLLLSLRRDASFRLKNELRSAPVLRLGSDIGETIEPIKHVQIHDLIPKKSNWDNSLGVQKRIRPKLRNREERYKPKGNFGRTSIPIVGKRGVFDENYN